MYFGCSIHGQLDLNEDGLTDLAVGSLGNAVLLWLAIPHISVTVLALTFILENYRSRVQLILYNSAAPNPVALESQVTTETWATGGFASCRDLFV